MVYGWRFYVTFFVDRNSIVMVGFRRFQMARVGSSSRRTGWDCTLIEVRFECCFINLKNRLVDQVNPSMALLGTCRSLEML